MHERRITAAPLDGMELLGVGTTFRDEVYDMLTDVPLFDNFSPDELSLITAHINAYRAPAGITILNEGERGCFLCIVVEGRVGVFKQDGNGEKKQIAAITPGKCFGEMSLIDELPYSAGIAALTDTKLVLISRDNFRRIVDDHPVLGVRLVWKIARLISLRLRQTSGQLVDYLE